MIGVDRHADTAIDGHGYLIGQIERLAQRLANLVGHPNGIQNPADHRQNSHKLVTADTRQRIRLAQAGLHTLGDRAQQPVADRMPVVVVHRLEPVKVDHQQGQEGILPARLGNGHANPVVKQAPVGQLGQRVQMGQARHLRGNLRTPGDIGRHPTKPRLALRIAEHADRQQHSQARAILAHIRPFVLVGQTGGLCLGDERLESGFHRKPQFLRQLTGTPADFLEVVVDKRGLLTDHLLGRVAQHRFRAGAEQRDDTVPIDGNDSLRKCGQYRRAKTFLFTQRPVAGQTCLHRFIQ